ncbi:TPA: hypothetical protein ACH3X3_012704 [Trebouxia sp. C0006]
MSDYNMQLTEDAKDDADFQPSPNKVPLAALFVDMPEFDVNFLFDESQQIISVAVVGALE